jgi:signal transduction histidine kinase
VRIYGDVQDGAARIFVDDNGIGFEEKYLDRIFKPFQRLHGRTSSFEGTGMGLAIVRKIVERHGGSITAISAPGKGSTFIVILPVKEKSNTDDQPLIARP